MRDPIFEAYVGDKAISTAIVSLLAVVAALGCAYFRVHISIIILIGLFIVAIWCMYFWFRSKVFSGAWMQSESGRAAFGRWMSKRGGTPVSGISID